jgi:trans-2,3-dihydro-3-hydroxyanthranilate isomerase
MKRPLHIVDVFAERPYSGNPLAVVLGMDGLSHETMVRIAAEMNFSETTFVHPVPDKNGGYRIRIFTPAREIDFAGHPILGTAWIIRHHVVPDLPDLIRLNLSIGTVTVTFELSGDNEIVWFQAPPMSLGKTCRREAIAAALGIAADDIEVKTPVQQVSAGTSAVIVPLRSLDALQRCHLNLTTYSDLASQGFPPLVYVFCNQTRHAENNLSARFFFEAHGVREDPATGNGAAFLGAYLLHHDFFSQRDLLLRIEQGYMIQRPSLVMLRARVANGSNEISVGGPVIPIVRGELMV